MNAVILSPPVSLPVRKDDDEWKRICQAVVYRKNLDLLDGNGRITPHSKGAVVFVMRPVGLTDDEAQAIEDELAAEFDAAIRMAWRVRAMTTLEGVEQIDRNLREAMSVTNQAVEAISKAAGTAKTAAEMAEVARTWLPRIAAAWVWVRTLG